MVSSVPAALGFSGSACFSKNHIFRWALCHLYFLFFIGTKSLTKLNEPTSNLTLLPSSKGWIPGKQTPIQHWLLREGGLGGWWPIILSTIAACPMRVRTHAKSLGRLPCGGVPYWWIGSNQSLGSEIDLLQSLGFRLLLSSGWLFYSIYGLFKGNFWALECHLHMVS